MFKTLFHTIGLSRLNMFKKELDEGTRRTYIELERVQIIIDNRRNTMHVAGTCLSYLLEQIVPEAV
jgi:hypothetical protein